MCSSVVLPAPLGPSRPVTPGPTVKLMSLTATTLPYQREACSTSMTGAAGELAGGMRASSRSCLDALVAARQHEQRAQDPDAGGGHV